ncbi:zinc-finger domain-containing protein [Thiomicrorhabdus indica]|uniref:zinc-finger domain-containing protein n=1 Tax=Thiomicrorhabdus indica TaxID=2267253 RepID=UPI00102E01A9|nr:zinc-finger domain-containing protein [Thiomicrorhabdus indica]
MASNSTNSKKVYEVTHKDLPLHCPTPEMSQWNSHPKVYLPIEKTGKAKCPYCGAEYILTDFDPNAPASH